MNTIPKVKYKKLTPPHPVTRQSLGDPCDCSVCELARCTLHQQTQVLLDTYLEPPPVSPTIVPTVIKICTLCRSEIGSGKPHTCNKTSFRVNTLKYVKQKSVNTRGRLTSDLVKDQFEEQGATRRGGTVALPGGGPSKVKLTMGAQAAGLFMKPKSFSHQNIISIIGGRNLSDRAAL